MAKNLTDIYVGVKKNDKNRNKNDLYRTPPLATHILCKYTDVPKNIVEPCAGYGNIAIELSRKGHTIHCFDLNEYEEALVSIQTGQDAMTLPKVDYCDGSVGVVTNPPFFKDLPRKLAEKFVSEYDYVAFFTRLTFLEGIRRHRLFKENPPSNLIILSDRISFASKEVEPVEMNEQLDGMIAYCWVIWNKNSKHQNTKIDWVLLREEYEEWRENYEKFNY